VNVVDSSAWLCFFAGDANADVFAPAIENLERLVVPALSIYEVFKRTLQQRGEHDALVVAAAMQQLPGAGQRGGSGDQVSDYDGPWDVPPTPTSL
jgi:predicted nucleic acid-binding protein